MNITKQQRGKFTDILDDKNIWLLKCDDLSFFEICETFIRDPKRRRPLHNICSLMRKSGAKWLMIHNGVEKELYFKTLYPSIKSEIDYLKKKYPKSLISVRQLTFFGSDVKWPPNKDSNACVYTADKGHTTKKKNDILATCIIIQLTRDINSVKNRHIDYLYEAAVAIPSASYRRRRIGLLNNYIHIFADTSIIVAGYEFKVNTSYFCQQNGIKSVCAHSCLKMTLWHAGEAGQYQPSTEIINNIVRKMRRDKGQKFSPAKGISVEEVRKICSYFGSQLFVADFEDAKNAGISVYELVYLLVESGIPTVIVFKPNPGGNDTYHMVPVIGHTFNSDEWFPLAIRQYNDMPMLGLNTIKHDYLSSAEWASHLIIHDDLLGTYLCIGPQSLTRKIRPNEDLVGTARFVLGILPKGLDRLPSPVIAQKIGGVYFWNIWERLVDPKLDIWHKRANERWKNNETRFKDLVLRTQLISGKSYINHLKKLKDHLGNPCEPHKTDLDRLANKLPDLIWMVEFSFPELFCANRTKLGEITMTLEATEETYMLTLKEGQRFDPPLSYRFIDTIDLFDGDPITINCKSHTPLYRRKPKEFEF